MGLLAVLVKRRAGQGHETSTGGLKNAEGGNELEERVDSDRLRGAVEEWLVSKLDRGARPKGESNLHFDDAAVSANIQYLAAELVGEVCDALEMLMLVPQRLAGYQAAGVEVLGSLLQAVLAAILELARFALGGLGGNLAVMSKKFLKVLGAENVDLGQEQLSLHESGLAVVENGPDGDQVLQLPARLLNNTVLTGQDNGHAGEIINLGVANNERVDVEASGSQDTRDARQHTRLVLDQAVQDVTLGRGERGGGGLVEDVGNGGLGGRPGRRSVGSGERRMAAADGLVGNGRGRAAVGAVPKANGRLKRLPGDGSGIPCLRRYPAQWRGHHEAARRHGRREYDV